MLSEKLNAIKFQGKPESINPLINSVPPNSIEKIKKERTTLFEEKIENKYVINP